MSKFDELMSDYYEAKEVLSEREQNRDEFLKTILFTLLGWKPGIAAVYVGAFAVSVDYVWSRRGYSGSDSIQFPRSIVDSLDPTKAASEYRQQLDNEVKAQERQMKQAQLDRLRKELEQ